MTRSRIGPLALESPLGERGSSLYRAVHIQQRTQVAVRVFSQPMGMTPESKQEFAQQLESLKALKHPNIARCYGGGFDAKDAYLVYELVDGESLYETLKRKERLPWELVLDLGLQLCDALNVAHQAGWFHGRIRPDKIIVSRDGSKVKLSDFRKGPGSSKPLTAQQLCYCAPESFADKPSFDAASDLYSVGAIMYHALTGQAPFQGANPTLMRTAILETTAPPVATLVFDCPVWLSSIVEQMLSKDPVRRPFSAYAATMALNEAHRRASEGTSVAEHTLSGFSPLQLNTSRAEAEKALGQKKKKKRRLLDEDGANQPGVLERPPVLLAILLAVVALISYLVWPLSEATLRARAEQQIASEEFETSKEAPRAYLLELIERFPKSKNAEWAKIKLDEIDMEIEMEVAEARFKKNRRFDLEPSCEGEKKFAEANKCEVSGDPITALELYKGIVALLKDDEQDRAFVNLARRQIKKIEAKKPSEEELSKFLSEKLKKAEKLLLKDDKNGAKQIWEGIINLYNENSEMKSLVEEARLELRKLSDPQ